MSADVDLGEAGGLAYRSAGTGRPLVLLHPGTGLDVGALGFDPAGWDLLGHSFGGYVALELNRLHPGELERIIASCTDGSEALADVTVLAIAGERDPQPRSLRQRIADASPRGTLAVIVGAGHVPFAETPERYWPVVARWLAETAP